MYADKANLKVNLVLLSFNFIIILSLNLTPVELDEGLRVLLRWRLMEKLDE